MLKKLVSVIIPTYNRPKSLKKAIDSVLEQTYQNIEVIVVDDNNPDTKAREETKRVMKDYEKYTNIKYLQHPKNLNGSAARNTGIRKASGEYIAFLDNDDEFMNNKIKLQVEKLEELGESYGVVYTKFVRKNKGRIIDKGIESRTGKLSLEVLKGTFYISAGSNILVRRNIVERIEGFNEKFNRRQDLEFLIRALKLTKIAHVDKVCLLINKDDRSNVPTESRSKKDSAFLLETFNDYIESQSDQVKLKIIIHQKLLALRPLIYKGKILSIKRFADEENIRYSIILKYMFYLAKRKLLKQCYGFKF